MKLPARRGGLSGSEGLFNRDLSWLSFNDRVLAEAADPTVPPLERLRFVTIVSSNLDEFFMVRVGEISQIARRSPNRRFADGLTVAQVLAQIREIVIAQKSRQAVVLQEIIDELALRGIRIYSHPENHPELDAEIRAMLPEIKTVVRRSLDPLPALERERIHVFVRFPGAYAIMTIKERNLRLLPLPSEAGTLRYALLERWLCARAAQFFPQREVIEAFAFKLISEAQLRYRPDEEETLPEQILVAVEKRSNAKVVRLEVDAGTYTEGALFLATALRLDSAALYRFNLPLDTRGLATIYNATGTAAVGEFRLKRWFGKAELMNENPAEGLARRLGQRVGQIECEEKLLSTAANFQTIGARDQTLFGDWRWRPLTMIPESPIERCDGAGERRGAGKFDERPDQVGQHEFAAVLDVCIRKPRSVLAKSMLRSSAGLHGREDVDELRIPAKERNTMNRRRALVAEDDIGSTGVKRPQAVQLVSHTRRAKVENILLDESSAMQPNQFSHCYFVAVSAVGLSKPSHLASKVDVVYRRDVFHGRRLCTVGTWQYRPVPGSGDYLPADRTVGNRRFRATSANPGEHAGPESPNTPGMGGRAGLAAVVGRLNDHLDVVRVRLFQAGGRDAHKLALLLQLGDGARTGVKHRLAKTTEQLVDDG